MAGGGTGSRIRGQPEDRTFGELPLDAEEDLALRAVLMPCGSG